VHQLGCTPTKQASLSKQVAPLTKQAGPAHAGWEATQALRCHIAMRYTASWQLPHVDNPAPAPCPWPTQPHSYPGTAPMQAGTRTAHPTGWPSEPLPLAPSPWPLAHSPQAPPAAPVISNPTLSPCPCFRRLVLRCPTYTSSSSSGSSPSIPRACGSAAVPPTISTRKYFLARVLPGLGGSGGGVEGRGAGGMKGKQDMISKGRQQGPP